MKHDPVVPFEGLLEESLKLGRRDAGAAPTDVRSGSDEHAVHAMPPLLQARDVDDGSVATPERSPSVS